jgi:exo-beta-1,3-glucanase (GH17 family)
LLKIGVRLSVATLVAAIVAATAWAWFDRPVAIDHDWAGPVESVSFAPFRRGQSPLTERYPTPAQVEEDMRALVGLAGGVRTYSARQGMEALPEIAEKLGLKVTLGGWLGTSKIKKERERNELEMATLIAAANAHPDSVSRVIVGSEVLLRRDLPPDELIAWIRKVKAAVRQPVSYADVWAYYLKHPEVAREVDFITIHILPFWEDEPISIDDVERHVMRIVELVRNAYPGKPILIGEAGWPSLGRDRGPAVVDTVNQARFVRVMAELSKREGFDYNIVEAFDQPWKSALENTVGAAWGILDVDRKPKFAMAGPVENVPDWPRRATFAVGLGVVATLIWGRRLRGIAAPVGFALLVQAVAWLVVTTAFHVEAVSFIWWQELWAVLRIGLAVALAGIVLDRVTGAKADRWHAETVWPLVGVYAVVWTTLLFVDGRYRDIPEIDFAVPALAALVFCFFPLGASRAWQKDVGRRLAIALPLAAVAALVSESRALLIGEDFLREHATWAARWPLLIAALVRNREMDLWAAMQLALALPYWRRGRSSFPRHARESGHPGIEPRLRRQRVFIRAAARNAGLPPSRE